MGISWKVVKRTPFYKSKEVDLTSGLEFFDALTEYYRKKREDAPMTVKDKLWSAPEMLMDKVREKAFFQR